eukprot:763138-Hanusia_phi.AAC.4
MAGVCRGLSAEVSAADQLPAAAQALHGAQVQLLWLYPHAIQGCEVIANCLGEHGEVPKTEHVVVNAVSCRTRLKALSPLFLTFLRREFRFVIPGMYIFQDGREDVRCIAVLLTTSPQAQVFYDVYDKFRWDFSARWRDIHAAMKNAAWQHVDMEYERLHSDILEVTRPALSFQLTGATSGVCRLLGTEG